MISYKSLQYFLLINTLFTSVSFIHYSLLNYIPAILMFLCKNYIILRTLQHVTQPKPYIFPMKDVKKEFNLVRFIISSAIEATAFSIVPMHDTHLLKDIIYFIPQSFLFELVFDLFHYTTHRAMHYPFFYKFHKKHHQEHSINEYTTFNHSTVDLMVTNFLPILGTFYIVRVSRFTGVMLFWYKTTVEISGHSGKHTSSSFIQCIYLPKLLGIELISRNHLYHHINSSKNFSKRFSIWDKVFGTFKDE